MTQALSAVISISCGLAAVFCPSSSNGSSTLILNGRFTTWPPIVYESTIASLRVCPFQCDLTRNSTIPLAGSFSTAAMVARNASTSRPFTWLSFFASATAMTLLLLGCVDVGCELPALLRSAERRRQLFDLPPRRRRDALQGR